MELFVGVVSRLDGDRPMSTKFRKIHRPPLLPIMLPISITSVLSMVFERLVSIYLGRLWNAVECFQIPSWLIGKVWVPLMHFCACPIHFKVRRVGRRLLSYRLISVQPLIGSTIKEFSISSALWHWRFCVDYIDP